MEFQKKLLCCLGSIVECCATIHIDVLGEAIKILERTLVDLKELPRNGEEV